MTKRLRVVATVVVVTLAALLVATVLTLVSPSPQVAQTEVYFRPQATLDATAQARVASYARLVDGRGGVRADALPGSLVVRLRATADDARTAEARVEAGTGLLQRRAASLEPATRGLATTVAGPVAVTSPARPWTRNLLLGALIGAALGMAVATLWARRARRLRSADDVSALLPLWVTDAVPVAGQVAALVRVEDPAAGYPRLAEGLRYLDVDVEGTTLVLASSRPGHDAAEVAARLAEHLTGAGKPVVLVDAAFARPQLAGLLGLPDGAGLVSVLAGEAALGDAVVVHEATGMHVLPAGPGAPDPVSLASSRALQRVLEQLRADHTTVLVLADALSTHDAAAVAAGSADGLLLVLREEVDTDRDLLHDVAVAEARGARVRGVALTRLAGLPTVRPEPVVPAQAQAPAQAPALVFPQVADTQEDSSSRRRIPAQRAGEPEPTVAWSTRERPEEARGSLLDDFLTGPDPEPVEDETAPGSDDLPAAAWDDDTPSIWRPRAQ